jgi:hypothetical protein
VTKVRGPEQQIVRQRKVEVGRCPYGTRRKRGLLSAPVLREWKMKM